MKKILLILLISTPLLAQTVKTSQLPIKKMTVQADSNKFFLALDTTTTLSQRTQRVKFTELQKGIDRYKHNFIGAFKLTGRDTAKTDFMYSKGSGTARHLYWRRTDGLAVKLDSSGVGIGQVDSAIGIAKTELMDSVYAHEDTLYAAINLKASVIDVDTAYARILLETGNRISQDSTLSASIDLRVKIDSLINYINISGEGIKIAANKITFDGPSIFRAINGTTDSTTIDGGKLTTGTVIADSIRSTYLYGKHIVGGDITIGSLFGIDSTGNADLSGGTIGGFTFTGNTLSSNNMYLESGIASKLYLGGATYGAAKIGFNNDGSGKVADGHFYWDASGNITANSITVTGQIMTDSGSVINGQYIDSLDVGKLTVGTLTGFTIQSGTTGDNILISGGSSSIDFRNGTTLEGSISMVTGVHNSMTVGGGIYRLHLDGANDISLVGGSGQTTTLSIYGTGVTITNNLVTTYNGWVATQPWVISLGYKDSTWIVTHGSMVYPGAGIAYSTGSGWGTSITDNSSDWDAAGSWVTSYGYTDYVRTGDSRLSDSRPASDVSAWAKAPTDAAYATAGHNHTGVYLPVSGAGDIYTHNASEFQAAGSYLTSEVDGSTTNEIQTLGTSGNTITLTSGGSVTAPYATVAGSANAVTWTNVSSKPSFATVATSGSYTDLLDVPSTATQAASTSLSGYLSSTDWNTFNGKADAFSGFTGSIQFLDGELNTITIVVSNGIITSWY